MKLEVPEVGDVPWPTLGPQICNWIEDHLVFGPGDLRGQAAVIDDEKRYFVYRMYEVFPEDHPQAGRRRFKRAALSLAKGTAKALDLDTPLPTPTGWTTMGAVQVGDYLLGADGKPCRVTATSPVYTDHTCYRVEFSDGSSIVADAGHRWFTKARRGGDGVRTTQEIADSLYWHKSKSYCNHRIPLAAPLDLPDADLPIDPYVLGYWLGDGRTDDAEFTMHVDDQPNFEAQMAGAGYFVGKAKPDRRRPTTVAIRGSMSPVRRGGKGRTLVAALRDIGVLGNKHIPPEYLRASYSQRLALLQGLMDSDGTAWRGQKGNPYCAFSSTLVDLATGFLELAHTLGIRSGVKVSPAKINGRRTGAYCRVTFTPRDDIPVFRLPRKLEASKRRAVKESQALCRTIRSVELVPTRPVKCVQVDSADHLYLSGESMIPTHNTEFAAWLAAVELHPEGPVRCVGWKAGQPIGGPVTDPYIPMVAFTAEQSDELAYGALRTILEESRVSNDFDIGLERVQRLHGGGKAVSLSGSPNARDGARTTFQVFDEVHRFTLEKLKQAYQTMLANMPKRRESDAWSVEVTTTFEPGAGSVAESTMEYARAVEDGRATDSRLFFFHRQASDDHDLDTEEGARAAVIEASGQTAVWRDIESIVELWRDPTTDRQYWERVWTNRPVQSSEKAFDMPHVKTLQRENDIPDGSLITLGFDGAIKRDSTALVACDVKTGFMWMPGGWERPYFEEKKQQRTGETEWEVPAAEVSECVEAMFRRYNVWRMYADPPYWQSAIAQWQGKYGDDRVIDWWTNRRKQMAYSLQSFKSGMTQGEITHDGNEMLLRHIGNAYKQILLQRNEDGEPLWLIKKERPDSPLKIDAAMAGCLAWEARTDAIASGVHERAVFSDPDGEALPPEAFVEQV